MERKCLEKLYVRISEDMQSTEVITRIGGDITEKLRYLDGNWVDEKKYTCQKISPHDDQAYCHYIKIISGLTGLFKVFECGLCGKDFLYQYNLMRHIPIHTGARNFVCSICFKAFRQRSTLSQHAATHRNLRPHTCSVCSKSFSRSSTLATHTRTHSDEKIYKCQYCGKGFNQKINLENHVHTHTGAKPFKCDFCDKKFNQKSNLNCHKKTAHPGEKATLLVTPPETASPNPLPLLIPTVLNVKYKEENPLSKDTIVTVIKNSPPKQVMEKLHRNQTAFVLFIENDFVSPTETILKAIVTDHHEYALVRINTTDYGLIDVAWVVLRESIDKKNYKIFGYENELIRNQLVFCDDFCGMNIYEYIVSRSKLTKIGQQLERFEFDCHVFDEQTNTQDIKEEDWAIENFLKFEFPIENTEDVQCEELSDESDKVVIESEETINNSDEFQSLLEDDSMDKYILL